MPTVSTKNQPDVTENDVSGRVELARRRISEGFYNRPEVRRTVATLLLTDLARRRRPTGSSRPETA
ncbi:MAG TPA: hypothetical protein VFU59_12465 [Candidatus Eisenbacteria bacterium]|nr:hypothetical protein [Candidatus Eisenbacteria bacterium]